MLPAGEASPTDIRDQLRREHQTALAELEALRREIDDHRCQARLARLRRSWMIETEHEEVFGKLGQRYGAGGLAEPRTSYETARAKLCLLEEAKAA